MQIPLGPINDRVILRGMDGKSQHTHPTSQRRNEKASEPLTGQQLDSREPSPFQRSPEPPSLHQPRHAPSSNSPGGPPGYRPPLRPPRPPSSTTASSSAVVPVAACMSLSVVLLGLREPLDHVHVEFSTDFASSSIAPASRGCVAGGLWAAEIRLGGRGRGARAREAGEGGARAGEAPEGAQGRSAFRASRPRRGGGRGF